MKKNAPKYLSVVLDIQTTLKLSNVLPFNLQIRLYQKKEIMPSEKQIKSLLLEDLFNKNSDCSTPKSFQKSFSNTSLGENNFENENPIYEGEIIFDNETSIYNINIYGLFVVSIKIPNYNWSYFLFVKNSQTDKNNEDELIFEKDLFSKQSSNSKFRIFQLIDSKNNKQQVNI